MAEPTAFSNLQTPEQIAANRKLGQTLMMQGMSADPVQHWTQGLARVLQGGVGRMNVNSADDATKARQETTMNALNQSPMFQKLSPEDRGLIGMDPELMRSALSKAYSHKLDPESELKQKLLQGQIDMQPDARNKLRAETGMIRSHGNYYDVMGQAALQKADNGVERNSILKHKMYGDILQKFTDPDRVTEADWNGANQPGGIIHAAFGGPVPYEQRGFVLAQARRGRSALPEDTELIDRGVSQDEINEIKRLNAIRGALGYPGHGKQWVRQSDGQWVAQAGVPEGGHRPLSKEEEKLRVKTLERTESLADTVDLVGNTLSQMKGASPDVFGPINSSGPVEAFDRYNPLGGSGPKSRYQALIDRGIIRSQIQQLNLFAMTPKGQGTITDYERRLIAAINAKIETSPGEAMGLMEDLHRRMSDRHANERGMFERLDAGEVKPRNLAAPYAGPQRQPGPAQRPGQPPQRPNVYKNRYGLE